MPDRDEVARRLARAHFEIEPGIARIFTIRDNPEAETLPSAPIKLLEVNEYTSASGILPLSFGAAPASGFPFPSVIVEVTPDEFEKIQEEELRLPDGWSLGVELTRGAD